MNRRAMILGSHVTAHGSYVKGQKANMHPDDFEAAKASGNAMSVKDWLKEQAAAEGYRIIGRGVPVPKVMHA